MGVKVTAVAGSVGGEINPYGVTAEALAKTGASVDGGEVEVLIPVLVVT